jgi:shikimate kinase
MNIVLIGYRGCGKTTVGKMLAEQMWYDFVDVDDQVCRRFNNPSIAAIWEQHGEAEWRRVEVEVTRELMGKSGQVIGLGGGTLMQEGARQAVKGAQNTIRVYLRCEPAELLRRIEADTRSAATRPSLTGHGGGLAEIEQVLAEREPVYKEVADKEFDVTNVTPEDALAFVIHRCVRHDDVDVRR